MGALETMQTTINQLEIQSYLFGVILGLNSGDFRIRSNDTATRIEVSAFPDWSSTEQFQVLTYEGRDGGSWDEKVSESIFYSAKDMTLFVLKTIQDFSWIEWRL